MAPLLIAAALEGLVKRLTPRNDKRVGRDEDWGQYLPVVWWALGAVVFISTGIGIGYLIYG